jgi:hypothetical protein
VSENFAINEAFAFIPIETWERDRSTDAGHAGVTRATERHRQDIGRNNSVRSSQEATSGALCNQRNRSLS